MLSETKSRLAGKKLFLLFFLFIFATNPAYSQDTINVPTDYTTIQAGIDAATNGDVVLVAENTYYENINFNGKAITVASHFLVDEDTSHISNTIIDGSQAVNPDSGSVVYFASGEDTTSVLYGFTITGGTGHERLGGGIFCINSGAKILHNKIIENVPGGHGTYRYAFGGGIFAGIESGQYWIVIENNIITNNYPAGGWGSEGGGIFMQRISGSLNGRISNNIIAQNTCGPASMGISGGGIEIINCSPVISNNIITGNICYQSNYTSEGGGIHLWESNSILFNNIIADNNVERRGGGVYIRYGLPIFINNTIVNNIAGGDGGGISMNAESIIINSIIWGNIAPVYSQIYDHTGNLDVFYSDIQGGYPGLGNIDAYPEFVDTANGDFHLSNNSPCIGAGIDSLEIGGMWYFCPVTDLEDNPRPNPVGTMPDMGAYENGPLVRIEENFLAIKPVSYSLKQNYPNPFNPTTTIKYQLPELSFVTLKVYDVLGNEIVTLVNEERPIGKYEIEFNAMDLSSGVYFYQLKAGNYVDTKKMLLIK